MEVKTGQLYPVIFQELSPKFSVSDDNNVVVAGRGGKLLRTTDGGLNWIQQLSRTTVNLNGICFVDSSIGYVAGADGTILKTINGGFITDVEEIHTGNPELTRLPYCFLKTTPTPSTHQQQSGMKYLNRSFVTIKIYDILGNEIATLVNEEKPAGSYEVEFSAKGGSASGGNAYNLPSGIYFYSLSSSNFFSTKKMILLK